MALFSDSDRAKLKAPMGHLIPDLEVSAEKIAQYAGEGTSYVTVGDASTERAQKLGLNVRLEIVDGLEKRIPRKTPEAAGDVRIVRCKNPPGGITKEASEAVDSAVRAIRRERVRIVVDGEEDLLTITVCALLDEGFAVLYGQPNEGLVVVRAGQTTRNKAKSLLGLLR